jgi:transketolase
MDRKNYHTFVVIGDGESNEGMVWEAAMCASHYQLDNLTAILDRNNYQCDGASDNVMKLEPISDKWRAFGWEVRSCDGHNMAELVDLLDQAPFAPGKPSLLLANTVKGKGVSFMESRAEWHYRAPSEKELAEAIACLSAGCDY